MTTQLSQNNKFDFATCSMSLYFAYFLQCGGLIGKVLSVHLYSLRRQGAKTRVCSCEDCRLQWCSPPFLAGRWLELCDVSLCEGHTHSRPFSCHVMDSAAQQAPRKTSWSVHASSLRLRASPAPLVFRFESAVTKICCEASIHAIAMVCTVRRLLYYHG